MAAVYQSPEAECLVYTFKQGVLSAMAHDLAIRVARFTVTVGDPAGGGAPALEARFDATSLEVVSAMGEGGQPSAALSPSDKRSIERTIVEEVLHARRYPEIRYRASSISGEGDRREVRGSLTLHGITRELNLGAVREGGRWRAEAVLHQPDFAVKPYSAMLGTLRLKPDVTVRFSLPAAAP